MSFLNQRYYITKTPVEIGRFVRIVRIHIYMSVHMSMIHMYIIYKTTKHRKLTELQFIINFETNKFGFNKDIFFLSKYDTFKH